MTGADIVVGLDAEGHWQPTVAWAAAQAVREHRAITLVHVTDTVEELWHDTSGRDRRLGVTHAVGAGEQVLEQAQAQILQRAPDVAVRGVLRGGGVRQELHTMARDARMLVIGARRHRSLWARLFGTTSSAVADEPPCPVVAVHETHPGDVRRGVLLGLDDTEHTRGAVRFAFEQASLTDRPLTAIHVAPHVGEEGAPDAERELAVSEALAGLREEFPDVPVRTAVERGDPADVLLRTGQSMHLIVLGAHHRRPISELLLGSVVAPVVEQAACPVAVVPDRGTTDQRRTG